MSNVSDFLGGAPGLWVTGTAYTVGKVVLSPADFQYYVRKTNGAGATDPSADAANWKITGNAIKSIQRGVILMSLSNTTDVTITAVNVAKTELRFLGSTAGAGTTDYLAYVKLTSSTTVTAQKGFNNSSNTSVSWELTERY